MSKFSKGDRVMHSDVKEGSLPAYRDARGTVVEARSGYVGDFVRVHWDSDDSPEPNTRHAHTVVLAP